MTKPSCKRIESEPRISRVKPTDERITGRGGMTLFVRYLDQIGLINQFFLPLFAGIRKNRKGTSVESLLKQIFCFFFDGTSRHLTYFDTLQKDEGYAGAIETLNKNMVSSHAVKRFFRAFSWPLTLVCRRILLKLFLWRLRISRPRVIILDIDAMGMDNDDAVRREGVMPTYKKYKGFGPLQLTWAGFLVDTVFRSGDKHSNHGHSAERMLSRIVNWIRDNYRVDVPIVFHFDSGFMDQKLFRVIEGLGAGYISGGKLYKDIVASVQAAPESRWDYYFGKGEIEDGCVWEYLEFGDRRSSWEKFRRALFTRPLDESGQMLLAFARPCSVLYTNLGMGYRIDEELKQAGVEGLLTPEGIIECYHNRGRSEQTFRKFKEFADQKLPFEKFRANAAYYYLMCISFFLFEAFKEDVCAGVVELAAYPNTVRRKVIDIAAKIVSSARSHTLKISRAVWDMLDFARLWARCHTASCVCLE